MRKLVLAINALLASSSFDGKRMRIEWIESTSLCAGVLWVYLFYWSYFEQPLEGMVRQSDLISGESRGL